MAYQLRTPRLNTTPPLRGAFPLDKDSICTKKVKAYLDCVEESEKANPELTERTGCRELAKAYLECRLAHHLMEFNNNITPKRNDSGVSDAKKAKSGETAALKLDEDFGDPLADHFGLPPRKQ